MRGMILLAIVAFLVAGAAVLDWPKGILDSYSPIGGLALVTLIALIGVLVDPDSLQSSAISTRGR